MIARAVFVAVALVGALSAAHAARKERGITHEEAVRACSAARAHRFACREPFVDALIEREVAAAGRPFTPEQRERMRETGLGKIVADAAKTDVCAALADRMVAQKLEISAAKVRALDACYAEKDCRRRVECMLPLMQELIAAPASTR